MFPILNIITISPFLCEITAFLESHTWPGYNSNVSFLLGEHDGVSSFLRPGQLGEDNAGHAGLDDDPDHTLDALHDDRLRTLLRRLAGPVADGVLGLHAEQEGGGEVLVGQNTGDEGSIPFTSIPVVLLVVPVVESNQPPDEAEDEPGDHEAGKEGEESVAPLQVQDGREHVLGRGGVTVCLAVWRFSPWKIWFSSYWL